MGQGTFHEISQEIERAGAHKPKKIKMGWVGNLNSPLPDVPEYFTRPRLLEIAEAHPDLMDVMHVLRASPAQHMGAKPPYTEWRSPHQARASQTDKSVPGGNGGAQDPHWLSLEDLVTDYACLLDIGGNGYSGRLKYLLFSGRPLLMVERRYVEYWHSSLKPYEHFVPVREDLSDLVDAVTWVLAHPVEADRIARNALDLARELFTKEAICARTLCVLEARVAA
jgi:hypothetical protein